MTKQTERKLLLLILGSLSFSAVAVVSAALWVGSALAAPAHCEIGKPPADLPVEVISFTSESRATVQVWWIPGETEAGVVVLMHAIRGNRLAMLPRARFLSRVGFSVLLFDFQAHGESHGERITYGYLESRDAQAAVQFVRSRAPAERIGVLGTSLGGAAAILGDSPLQVNAIVLEAVYPDVRSAVTNRLRVRLGRFGHLAESLLICQLRPRLGVAPDRLRPIEGIRRVQCPLLIIAGTDDLRTTMQESRDLHAAAPEPKELWEVSGAAHVDFHRHAGAEYEKSVLAFLSYYLRGDGQQEANRRRGASRLSLGAIP